MVKKVPLGKVCSYGQIADLSGYPRQARIVSRALRSAAPEMLIPWHRIVRSNGEIAFPCGSAAAQEQTARLQQEQVLVKQGKVDMKHYAWKPDLGELLQMP